MARLFANCRKDSNRSGVGRGESSSVEGGSEASENRGFPRGLIQPGAHFKKWLKHESFFVRLRRIGTDILVQ